MPPASPADPFIDSAAMQTAKLAVDEWWMSDYEGCLDDCRGPTLAIAALERRVARAISRTACPDPTLHAVADAPLRPLSDLLRAATEFVDGDNHTPDAFDALRAAVRALQGPPAPFRPQQAHAAPANGGQL